MPLNKSTVNDKIEVVTAGAWPVVQVRTATVIDEDGVELSRSFNRHVLQPDADLSVEDPDVAAVASVVFTDEVKKIYADAMAEQDSDPVAPVPV